MRFGKLRVMLNWNRAVRGANRVLTVLMFLMIAVMCLFKKALN